MVICCSSICDARVTDRKQLFAICQTNKDNEIESKTIPPLDINKNIHSHVPIVARKFNQNKTPVRAEIENKYRERQRGELNTLTCSILFLFFFRIPKLEHSPHVKKISFVNWSSPSSVV